MPMKEWIYQLQPVQLYVVLTLSICYFILQLFLSHITHALTLLIDSYHMLCNIIALAGCIITIKVCTNMELIRHFTFSLEREILQRGLAIVFPGKVGSLITVDHILMWHILAPRSKIVTIIQSKIIRYYV